MINKKNPPLWFPIIMIIIAWAGCSATGQDKKEDPKSDQRPAVAVEVLQVSPISVQDGIDVIGSLNFKFETDVRSEYTGVVTAVYVTEWVEVRKGTPLAKLDTRELEVLLKKAKTAVEIAKANLLQAEVAAQRADREYERLLKLKEAGLVTQQNVDEGLTEKEATRARVAAARAQIQAAEDEVLYIETKLAKATIYAPVDGVISLRNVNVGDFVGEMGSKAMFKIVDDQTLDLILTVPSADLGAVKVGQTVSFFTDAIRGRTFTGKIRYLNPRVNEADRSVKVIAEVENPLKELKGGMFVKGRILTGHRRGVIKVPRNALVSWDVAGRRGELYVVEGDRARKRIVTTGAVSEGAIEVVSGLSAGERIITRGGFNVKDGDLVKMVRKDGEN
jgi:RND family efflux transporter MFP subunit